MPKIAEKLTILGKTGDALLLRLVHTKQVLNDANLKPAFLADNNNIKILANVIKKFPEITDVSSKSWWRIIFGIYCYIVASNIRSSFSSWN